MYMYNHFKISSPDEVFTRLFFIPGWNFICLFERVFTREISSRDEIIPVYGEMPLTVYAFLPRWNFIPVWTYSCQKQRWNFIKEWKKKKRCVNISSGDEILKLVFFFYFWRMYSNMLSKVNVFEHNESMNIMKHKASLSKVKSEKKRDEDNK